MFTVREEEIEERIEDIKDLMRIWMRFYRILSAGFDPENLTPEKEAEFQQIKTVVAQRHRHFMEVIADDEDKYIGQNILNLVKRVISLKEFAKLSPLEINKLSIEWHDANILLNEILGSLEYQLSVVRSGGHVKTQSKEESPAVGKKASGFLGSKYVKFSFVVVVLAVVVGVIFVYREQIQRSGFYQEYLSSYVEAIQSIFE
jgi:hypothetical protein